MTSIPVDISVTEVSMPVEPAPKTANDFPFDLRASDLLEFRIKSGQTNTFVKIASTVMLVLSKYPIVVMFCYKYKLFSKVYIFG